MTQADTQTISLHEILCSAGLQAGVADTRAGRPARFDEFPGWLYEWGRQLGFVLPISLPLMNGGRPNPDALDYLARAFDRGDLVG